MVWELTKSFRFEASHRLPLHDGKCARLHGHSWTLTVCVRRSEVEQAGPKQGMAVDYYDLSQVVKPLIEDKLDHHHLNDLLPNPTSEELSRWCFNYLRPLVERTGVLLWWVEISETCTTGCRFYGD